MRWPAVALFALAPVSLILGFVLNAEKAFQISTGILGAIIFATGGLVLVGVEKITLDE